MRPCAETPEETERRLLRDAAAEAWKPRSWGSTTQAVWNRARQRTAMEIAARLLDEAKEPILADWLLRADPRHAKAVAAGVAALALRNGMTAVWDALCAAGAMDFVVADELYFRESDLSWAPEPEWLLTPRRTHVSGEPAPVRERLKPGPEAPK